MASIALMIGGAIVNALAFAGANALFSQGKSDVADKERERHNKAVEQLQTAQTAWSRKRTARLDWINEDLRRQGHAVRTFRNVDEAIRQYNLISGPLEPIEPEPKLSDFYIPSPEQRDRETTFVIMGLGATAVAAYLIAE